MQNNNLLKGTEIRNPEKLDSELQRLKAEIKKNNLNDPILEINFRDQATIINYLKEKKEHSDLAIKKLEKEIEDLDHGDGQSIMNASIKKITLKNLKSSQSKYKLDKNKALYLLYSAIKLDISIKSVCEELYKKCKGKPISDKPGFSGYDLREYIFNLLKSDQDFDNAEWKLVDTLEENYKLNDFDPDKLEEKDTDVYYQLPSKPKNKSTLSF